ncbi:hypothetical protein OB955_17130 [Halobacteria archaeon AArc-m2/3/4]|uniref:Uncharacterized protein n=1 Tax=Natronoglomus mannanivorans TaxID=2979990 RepID=A0ABT2QHN3_9EURY|nr:hypothetical protein [Halobacteria archaeon AArc-m2/3/4]
MQFRAGILYVVLFVVVAAGAYGVIATAESPEVTIDEANADYVLEAGDEFEVDGQTFNVSELGAGTGTVEYVDEEAVLEVQWEGQGDGDWDGGDSVFLGESEDDEYHLMIIMPEAAEDDEDEAEPEEFLLIEAVDDDEFEIVQREGEPYVVVSEDGTEELVHVTDVDEIDTQVYQEGDGIEFYDDEDETMVDGEVTDIGAELVTVEYIGTEIDEYDLTNAETVTLNDQEFGVYFPSDEQVYLTSDLDAFQAQHDEIEDHGDRVQGLWWVASLAALTAIVIAGLAFMPVRG